MQKPETPPVVKAPISRVSGETRVALINRRVLTDAPQAEGAAVAAVPHLLPRRGGRALDVGGTVPALAAFARMLLLVASGCVALGAVLVAAGMGNAIASAQAPIQSLLKPGAWLDCAA